MSQADDFRREHEAQGGSCETPWTAVRLAWFTYKNGAMVLTHFWSVMPHQRKACTEAAEARHLFETLFPTLPPGAEWVPFDPDAKIPYRHHRN